MVAAFFVVGLSHRCHADAMKRMIYRGILRGIEHGTPPVFVIVPHEYTPLLRSFEV